MNEIYVNIWTCIAAIIVTAIICGCASTYGRTDDTVGRRDLELVGKLEAEFSEFDRRIGRIEETAGDIRTDAERLEYLFAEYIRCVQQLRSTVAEYKSRLAEETSAGEKADNSSSSPAGVVPSD